MAEISIPNRPLCACGCGLQVENAKIDDDLRGRRRGEPNAFLHGHNGNMWRSLKGQLSDQDCACGCGKKTKYEKGGRPQRYVHGHNRRDETLVDRFWSFVQKTDDGCWTWTGARAEFGYGVISDRATRRHLRAHRLSWEIAYGLVPLGMLVLHRCDNPPCVRPDHLFLGDHADNSDDKVAKGRQQHGERHAMALLSNAAVREIRRAGRDTTSRRALALKFGVKSELICNVQAGRSYRGVRDEA